MSPNRIDLQVFGPTNTCFKCGKMYIWVHSCPHCIEADKDQTIADLCAKLKRAEEERDGARAMHQRVLPKLDEIRDLAKHRMLQLAAKEAELADIKSAARAVLRQVDPGDEWMSDAEVRLTKLVE